MTERLTSDSWGKVVTKATKSSQPALRLMGFGARDFKTSVASLRAPTSSNIVPAFEWAINSVRARIAAMGIEIWLRVSPGLEKIFVIRTEWSLSRICL